MSLLSIRSHVSAVSVLPKAFGSVHHSHNVLKKTNLYMIKTIASFFNLLRAKASVFTIPLKTLPNLLPLTPCPWPPSQACLISPPGLWFVISLKGPSHWCLLRSLSHPLCSGVTFLVRPSWLSKIHPTSHSLLVVPPLFFLLHSIYLTTTHFTSLSIFSLSPSLECKFHEDGSLVCYTAISSIPNTNTLW